MLNLNGDCNREIVAKEMIEGFDFEPKCLVLLLSAENEKVMFDSMLAAGRLLSDDFEIRVNFTIATGAEPVVKMASTNCHNSKVLLENYELDRTGQDEITELAALRLNITKNTLLAAQVQDVIRNMPRVTFDNLGRAIVNESPPPAPPGQQGLNELIVEYSALAADATERANEIIEEYSDCYVADRASTTVCGLSSDEAPDPWIALDDKKCRGYDTREAREEDYCGYCKAVAIQTKSNS